MLFGKLKVIVIYNVCRSLSRTYGQASG